LYCNGVFSERVDEIEAIFTLRKQRGLDERS